MTHRDGLPRFSARSVRCGDASHRKACATPSESLGKPPFRSPMRPVGGRRKALPMRYALHRLQLPSYPTGRLGDPYGSLLTLLGIRLRAIKGYRGCCLKIKHPPNKGGFH